MSRRKQSNPQHVNEPQQPPEAPVVELSQAEPSITSASLKPPAFDDGKLVVDAMDAASEKGTAALQFNVHQQAASSECDIALNYEHRENFSPSAGKRDPHSGRAYAYESIDGASRPQSGGGMDMAWPRWSADGQQAWSLHNVKRQEHQNENCDDEKENGDQTATSQGCSDSNINRMRMPEMSQDVRTHHDAIISEKIQNGRTSNGSNISPNIVGLPEDNKYSPPQSAGNFETESIQERHQAAARRRSTSGSSASMTSQENDYTQAETPAGEIRPEQQARGEGFGTFPINASDQSENGKMQSYEERLRRFAEEQLMSRRQQQEQEPNGIENYEEEEEDGEERVKKGAEESEEIRDIKDQVRRLQQQQMCQIQMLNYLHFQLTMVASVNPQAQQQQQQQQQQQAHTPQQGGPFMAVPPFAPGVNGMQLQGVPQLLAAMVGGGAASAAKTPQGGMERPFAQSEVVPKQESSRDSGASFERKSSFDAQPQSNAAINRDANNGSSEDYGKDLPRYGCRFCQKEFGSESALHIHVRSHTGCERQFKCNVCAARFGTRAGLRAHFARHRAKYPQVEMNPHPVPEYLDNIPTQNGIPFGMSVIPDASDLLLGARDGQEVDETPGQDFPAPSERQEMSPSKESESGHGLKHEQPNVEDTKMNQHARKLIQHSSLVSKSSAFPFCPPSIYRKDDQAKATEQLRPFSNDNLPTVSDSQKERSASEEIRRTSEAEGPQRHSPPAENGGISGKKTAAERGGKGSELEKNECHICRRVLSCQSALKLHYRTHTGERPYKCDLCSRAFTTRGNLRTHYSSVHRQQLRPSPPQGHAHARPSVLQCPLCGNRFMDQQSLQQHMQMHLYINSQQQHQRQIAQLISGQRHNGASLHGYRILPESESLSSKDYNNSITNNSNITNSNGAQRSDERLSPTDHESSIRAEPVTEEDQQSGSNDEVFEDRSPGRQQPPSLVVVREIREIVDSADGEESHTPPAASPEENNLQQDVKMRQPSSALDLTRQMLNSAGEIRQQQVRSVSPQEQSQLQPPHPAPESSGSSVTASQSLDALALLASSSGIMRPGGLSMINRPVTPLSEDARSRKMTTSCELCSKPFTCQSALEIHLRSHTKERPYLCRVCERGFTTKGNLKQHLLTHNITEVDDDMLEPVGSPLAITAAGNSSTSSPVGSPLLSNGTLAIGAIKRPSDSVPQSPAAKRTYPRHWCHICQKQFSSASSLQIHNRTHTGEKPFACSVCGRAFTTKGNLKVHMGTHVWGAGGSRRGRRISMDNPLISPWMQNTSNTNTNPAMRPHPPQPLAAVHDPAAIYQQYAALASGLMGAKATTDPRFHTNGLLNLNNAAAARLLIPQSNGHVTSPAQTNVSAVGQTLNAIEAMKANDNKNISAAEWFWKAYQRTQEQVN